MKKLTYLLYLLLAGFLASVCQSAPVPDNKAAPDFAVPSLAGSTVKLSDFSGKAVVLNFWGTWCEPCRKETPDLLALQQQFDGKGVVIIGAAMDRGDDAAVKSFTGRYRVNYLIVLANKKLLHDYGVMVAPMTVIISPGGNLIYRHIGAISRSDISHRLTRLLSAHRY